jgi:hypothetical protein
MIPERMPARGNFFRQRWKCPHACPNQEESRSSMMTIQQVEQPMRNPRVRPVIKRERNTGGIARPSYRRTEQLRAWRHRAPRKDSSGGTHASSRHACI